MVLVSGKVIEQLRPWIKATLKSTYGTDDASLVIATVNCLEKQLGKTDTQAALEDLMAPGMSAAFVDKLYAEIDNVKAKKKSSASTPTALPSSPPAPNSPDSATKRKREDEEAEEKDSKRSRSEKDDKDRKHRDRDKDRHKDDHKHRDKERDKDRDREKDRDRRDKDRDRDRESRKDKDRDRDRDRDREKDKDRKRDKDKEKEKDRDREKDKDRKDRSKDKDRDEKDREREKEREKEREREKEKEREREKEREERDRRDREKDRESRAKDAAAALAARLAESKAKLAAKVDEQKKKLEAKQTMMPPPLILDSQGREVDAAGKLVTPTVSMANLKTIKANKKFDLLENAQTAPDVTKSKYYDPRVAVPKVGRAKREWSFVEHGTYMKRAEKRAQKAVEAQLLKELQGEQGGEIKHEPKAEEDEGDEEDFNPNMIQLGVKEEPKAPEDPIPDIEWWDAAILQDSEGGYPEGIIAAPTEVFKHDVWQYIEHPPMQDIAAPAPAVLPLMLTKKELKKLRKSRRAEQLKDQQDRVLLGIEAPPPPKVKISNLMRVLMNEAVQDPTQIEKQVREQMEARQKAHDDRNQARKLTKEEKWAKKKRKFLEDAAKEMHCALFKVGNLDHPALRSKVDRAAQDCLMSGAVLLARDMNLVIIEGGTKAIRKYKKLMLNRIKWAEPLDGEEADPLKKPNSCDLVWEGVIQKGNFKHFVIEQCPTDAVARRFLAEHSISHFWDMAKNYRNPLEI